MSKPNLKLPQSLIIAILGTILCSCSSELGKESTGFFSRLFNPDSYKLYRIDITQGNILEQSKVAQVKTGMSKNQLLYLLGVPVLPTVFHDDRWDYIYYNNILREEVELYRLTLFFDGDRIERLRKTKNLIENKPVKTSQ